MKSLFLSFLFSLLILPGFAQKEKYKSATFTDSQGTELNYRILYPKNYQADKKYPLILFLHGAGERGNDNESQLKHGSWVFTDKLKENPAIVILPQCPKEGYWSSANITRDKYPLEINFNYNNQETPALHAAIELTKSFIKTKKADKHRVYITGLSMGGMGTFEAVYRYPKLFAAAMPVCGGGEVSAYGKKQAKIPFWIFHGDVDGVVDVQNSREMYAKLKSLNANVTYTEYPGVNHNSWDNAFKEEAYPTWFFQFKR
ncbi:carboxylesterase family protein [Arcticibacterium luteifluviistationis]|uniref:Phospholipase n=1 Tax=Arcticibacterium luteifluviistationis TaxID=1784714 RepID=A0A2Z4GB27_9BACT|nr:prolyl oligopeptidase family serine peptidase [Arcticibacterium luteifluviistationis]AWV98344.1 phospholipase [Arcticibacterium luteifluviistationis]